jgi:hypothetical protein
MDSPLGLNQLLLDMRMMLLPLAPAEKVRVTKAGPGSLEVMVEKVNQGRHIVKYQKLKSRRPFALTQRGVVTP